jgi:hypothetical protein
MSFDHRARRNFLIRAATALTGEATIGVALAAGCIWAIQAASLGLFFSFVMWLITALLALALSQHLVHPAVAFVLSDAKLDRGIEVLRSVAIAVGEAGGLHAMRSFVTRRA